MKSSLRWSRCSGSTKSRVRACIDAGWLPGAPAAPKYYRPRAERKNRRVSSNHERHHDE
ncbi:MAG TPA: hypothetical protein PKM73_18860 [Verrucomicrobiota bacterium]|nr:hypothetical protein [Verrucomicrobiota bacterium]HNU52952.1 hypothetical protein [Verrucomicrobiota bacterium]